MGQRSSHTYCFPYECLPRVHAWDKVPVSLRKTTAIQLEPSEPGIYACTGVRICRYGAKIGESPGPLAKLVPCLGDTNAFRLVLLRLESYLVSLSLMSLPIN